LERWKVSSAWSLALWSQRLARRVDNIKIISL